MTVMAAGGPTAAVPEPGARVGLVGSSPQETSMTASTARKAARAGEWVIGGICPEPSGIATIPAELYRKRPASNSFVRLCRGAFGSRNAATHVIAAVAARYIAGASDTPVRAISHSATNGVVPPSSATPAL